MDTTRMMRGDSILAGLPVEQREQVEDWLMVERLPLREVQRKLKEEFGVAVCHDTVARYERRLRQLSVVEDLKESMVSAQGLPGDFSKDGELLQQASLLLMRQRAFELLSAGDCDVPTLERIGRLLVRLAELEIRAQRLKVAEFKATEQAMAKAWAKAEELRPIWNAEHLEKDAKLREALLKVTGKLDSVNQRLYEKDQAEKEARRCAFCQQVRPKDWEERMVHEAKMKLFQAMMGGGAMKKEECRVKNEGKENPKAQKAMIENQTLETKSTPQTSVSGANPKQEKLRGDPQVFRRHRKLREEEQAVARGAAERAQVREPIH